MGTLKSRTWNRIALFSGPVMILVTLLASFFPTAVERWYSRGVYPWIATVLAYVFHFPFPSAEVLVLLLLIGGVFIFLRGLYRLFQRNQGTWFHRWRHGFLNLLKFLSVAIALFLVLWGINYQRKSWGEDNGWVVTGGTSAQLQNLAESLEQQASLLRRKLPQTTHGLSLALGGVKWDSQQVFHRIAETYARAGERNPLLRLSPSNSAHPLWGNFLFSELGIAGIFIPFTGEPLVNCGPGGPMVAFDAAHEMSHERGWAREDEANFLAFYVLTTSGETDLAYAGTQAALMYVLNALDRISPSQGRLDAMKLDPGIQRDWRAYFAYWQRFEGPVEKAAQGVNDAYLKAQGQKEGIHSYGLMVDLLLAYAQHQEF